jgi:hypothetical protein
MVAKRDDHLITTTTSQLRAGVTAAAAIEESEWNAQHQELLSFQMLPMKLVEATKRTPRDEGAEEVLFQHLVQYRNIMSWKDEHIVPSTHLDLEISTDQTSVVLKLRTADITLGALMGLAHGDGAKKKLARRRLNLVDADINAWICLVNSPERQELTKESLQLVSALAELEADKQHQKGANKEKKEKAKQDKAIKAQLEAEMNQSKCAVVLQKEATDGADLLKKPDFFLLLKHYYKVKVPATTKIADLRLLFTCTVAAASVIGNVESDVGDAVSGVGAAPAEEADFLSSDNDDADQDK